MFNKKVIVLCGRGQSGKSTAAKMLKDADPGNVERMAFADPLKRMLLALGVPEHNLYGCNVEKSEPLEILSGYSARHAMQTLGTEWRNTLAEDLWARNLEMRIRASKANRIVIDDMRFAHEYERFLALGATIIGLERTGQGTSNDNHASETWDFKATGMPVLLNNGTVEDLKWALWPYV